MNLDLILLCGGQGTRFQAVSNTVPKVLIKIGNLTFLDYVINKCIKLLKKSLIVINSPFLSGVLAFHL